jgi:DNA-binding Lrp family transcriptional regulator
MPELTAVDRQIIDNLQGEFPICERPYAEVAERLGITEYELLQSLERLLADKVLTRFGPMYQIERMGAHLCWPRWLCRKRVTRK